jgi:putative transposase
VIVDYIDAHKDRFGVAPICTVLSEHGLPIAPSTYYRVRALRAGAGVSEADLTDAYAANAVLDCWRANRGVYGVRKLWHAMRRQGHLLGRDQVSRLMGIVAVAGARRGVHRTVTTQTAPGAARHPDLVRRGWHTPTAPDQLWVADFTYAWTLAGFVYVAFVTDVCSRRILGWRVSTSRTSDLVTSVLQQALFTRRRADAAFTATGLIHHSDAGSQGGFNRWSQHLVRLEVFDGASAASGRSCGQTGDALAWSAVSAQGRGAGVLAPDRGGLDQRERRGRGRRVGAGRLALVPQRWRHAADQSRAVLGPVPVVC